MNKEKAIADLEWMRKTHVDWAEYFEAHPQIESEYVGVFHFDDAKEHRRIAAMYDNALECLRGG